MSGVGGSGRGGARSRLSSMRNIPCAHGSHQPHEKRRSRRPRAGRGARLRLGHGRRPQRGAPQTPRPLPPLRVPRSAGSVSVPRSAPAAIPTRPARSATRKRLALSPRGARQAVAPPVKASRPPGALLTGGSCHPRRLLSCGGAILVKAKKVFEALEPSEVASNLFEKERESLRAVRKEQCFYFKSGEKRAVFLFHFLKKN